MNEKVIQWYPGHMAKTRRLMKESLPLIDAVCELVDARVPESSRNPDLDGIIGSKPRIVLLNKCDLADERATARKIKELAERGVTALPVDCRSGKGLEKFEPAVREVLKDKIKANADKGMAGKPLRVMVVGIPNTGKSSFINRMAGKYRAKVADKPGVTRGNQWFAIGSGIELLDTPGVLWPKFEDPEVGMRLAYTGAVKEDVIDTETLACHFIALLAKYYPQTLLERYKLEAPADADGYDLLQLAGKKRGYLVCGGEVNTERMAKALMDDYRSGKLGRLTLEAPED